MLYGGPLYEQTTVYVLIFLLIYRIFPVYAITNSDVMKSLNIHLQERMRNAVFILDGHVPNKKLGLPFPRKKEKTDIGIVESN